MTLSYYFRHITRDDIAAAVYLVAFIVVTMLGLPIVAAVMSP